MGSRSSTGSAAGSYRWARAGVVVALLAVALTFASASWARGHGNRPFASLPHLGPAPVRCELGTDPACPEFTQGTNFTVESSCGAINISPHVVGVGQDLTATMVLTARMCRIQWGTPPGKLVAGCKDGVYKVINPQVVETIKPPSSICQWKATSASSGPPDAKAPGGGWDQFEVGFCAFVGCAALASDFYYVLPHKKAISGTVYSGAVDANGFRLGLADAVIKLSGPSSGTAVTDKSGFYDALVDPGKYTVHVESVGGQTATGSALACSPGSVSGADCKLDVTGHDGVADFTSCGGGGPAVDAAGPSSDVARAASASGGCPLKVLVKQLESLRSGLAVHSPHYNQAPADFTHADAVSRTFTCESGCTDVLVTVIDPQTHKKVPNATVDASVGDLSREPLSLPDGREVTPPAIGDPFLCDTLPDGNDDKCGSHVLGLTTDADGQVHLRYWTPGVITEAKSTLNVIAKLRCSAGSCPVKEKEGSSKTTLTAKPYLIYEHANALTKEELEDLVKWAGGGNVLTKFLESSTQGYNVLKRALTALHQAEIAAAGAAQFLETIEHYEPVVAAADIGGAINSVFEAQGMIALFLHKTGLSPIGLGSDPFEASASGAITPLFTGELVNQILAPSALKIGSGGFWMDSAELLRRFQDNGNELGKGWSVHAAVYEVSHCDPTQGSCGPGYGNDPGSASVIRAGIQPELAFYLSLVHNGVGANVVGFSIRYDTIAWTGTQPGLKGVIQDFK